MLIVVRNCGIRKEQTKKKKGRKKHFLYNYIGTIVNYCVFQNMSDFKRILLCLSAQDVTL